MKFKVGDFVRIVANKMTPEAIGKVGEIMDFAIDQVNKVYFYKVRLVGQKRSLPGWAEEDCLAPAQNA